MAGFLISTLLSAIAKTRPMRKKCWIQQQSRAGDPEKVQELDCGHGIRRFVDEADLEMDFELDFELEVGLEIEPQLLVWVWV